MYVSFFDHHGFELLSFEFQKIVPTNLSPFNVSYATVAADFNVFTLNITYNRFKITRRLTGDVYTAGISEVNDI
jgi:hypothetical protein